MENEKKDGDDLLEGVAEPNMLKAKSMQQEARVDKMLDQID